ncbi:Uncharacterized protein AUMI_111440 [Aurantimicrobium minutum]|uniref:Uncharacterized protein n=1 Tax=Aurantimicrobium minutum TaxID=708131 RepID=A0A173LXG9_9MICO|nr:Uncharacterized protein AUMI_111440 [Aurantimicrobium minutum]
MNSLAYIDFGLENIPEGISEDRIWSEEKDEYGACLSQGLLRMQTVM